MERKRLEVELLKVAAARADLELRVLERQEEIERIIKHIDIQFKREAVLTDQLKKFTPITLNSSNVITVSHTVADQVVREEKLNE